MDSLAPRLQKYCEQTRLTSLDEGVVVGTLHMLHQIEITSYISKSNIQFLFNYKLADVDYKESLHLSFEKKKKKKDLFRKVRFAKKRFFPRLFYIFMNVKIIKTSVLSKLLLYGKHKKQKFLLFNWLYAENKDTSHVLKRYHSWDAPTKIPSAIYILLVEYGYISR